MTYSAEEVKSAQEWVNSLSIVPSSVVSNTLEDHVKDLSNIFRIHMVTPANEENIAKFDKWIRLMDGLEAFTLLAGAIAQFSIADNNAKEQTLAGFHALNITVRGVKVQFQRARDSAKEGKPYNPPPPTLEQVPDFPSMNGDFSGWVQQTQSLLKLSLQTTIGKMKQQDPNSDWIIVLSGIVQNLDDILKQIANTTEPKTN
jgi:hypothetical protein